MEDQATRLMDEFRSLLDETTILSISSDYNLQDTQDFAAAREVLLALSKDVEAEEATGFNPSGFGGDDVADFSGHNLGGDAEDTGVSRSDMKSAGGFTTTTESSTPPSLSSSGSTSADTPDPNHVGVFDGLSNNEKEQNLSEMFVDLKRIDIKKALEKSKGDASLAMDELLNLQWLEHTGQRPKGVDGFFVDEDHVPGKKKKGKRKKKAGKVSALTPPSTEIASEGAGQNAIIQSDKITLIADRLNLPSADVTSIYNRCNASLGATVIKILDNYISFGLPQPDSRLLPSIQQKTEKFSWIPREYINAILEICQFRDEALDVIQILADYFEKPAYLKYDVSYSVVASDPGAAATIDLVTASNSKQTARPSINSRSSATVSPQGLLSQATNLQAASAASKAFAESRNHSFTSAAAAFKKGRSDPLFRQAAVVYTERAREQNASYLQASSLTAGYLVDQQSTKDMIDLHGVTVRDGVNIALDRVWKWWNGLGEERARKAKQGFKVVTGLGKHSVDGKSQLRIQVFKALINDGWKAEVLTGSYLVTGRRQRL
ncbi:hypothetical protein F4818DRAFT_334300 [Hypoxylon cercidicola]|nr:hypothetical protein F4818DRAFT_334300 [Hypoxylon cercidicola]